MIIRENEIGENIKYWVRPDIINRIESKEIKAYFNSEITEIKENTITIKSEGKSIELQNDFVLAMTGYQPNYSLLENLNVEILDDEFKTPSYDEKNMRDKY